MQSGQIIYENRLTGIGCLSKSLCLFFHIYVKQEVTILKVIKVQFQCV